MKTCRGAFRASDNGKRTRRRTDGDVMAWAQQKRAEKLANLHPYQLVIGMILRNHGIRFEYEWIFENGDRPIFADLFLPDHHTTIELDDKSHDGQGRYDKDRAMFLARTYTVATVRFTYSEVAHGYAADRLKQMLGVETTLRPQS